MSPYEWLADWKSEENAAYIHEQDISHIAGRYREKDELLQDYRTVLGEYLLPKMRLLDIDTGGGAFLLSPHHPHGNAAMKNYPPNVALCEEVLLSLGIDFRPDDRKGSLPFEDGSFHLVINRHGDFNAEEIYGVPKADGLFITQQVGTGCIQIKWLFPYETGFYQPIVVVRRQRKLLI